MLKKFSSAPMRLSTNIFLGVSLLVSSATSVLTQNRASRFDPDGSFWVHGTPPDDFLDFGGINLNAKKLRRLPSPGLQLTDGTTYRFRTLVVKRNDFRFTTMTRNNVYYSFSGRFLRGGNFSETALDDEAPVMEGTLTKYRGGRILATAKMKFVYFGGT